MKHFQISQGIRAYKQPLEELSLNNILKLVSLYFNINKKDFLMFIKQLEGNRKVCSAFMYGSLANRLAYQTEYTIATDMDVFVVRKKHSDHCKEPVGIKNLDIHSESFKDLESIIGEFEKQASRDEKRYIDHIPFVITALATPIIVLKPLKALKALKSRVNALFEDEHLFNVFLLETPLKSVYKSVFYREDISLEETYKKRLEELEKKELENLDNPKSIEHYFEIFRLRIILKARNGGIKTLITYFKYIRKIPLKELSYNLRQQMYSRNFKEEFMRRSSKLLKNAYRTGVINPEIYYETVET